jgi:hypothetical protein
MKVFIGPYRSWISPYQIAEKILFWIPKYDENNHFEYTKAYDKYVHSFGEWLSEFDWLVNLCTWIESKRKRKIKIRIDPYDTWSADHTLAMIILPTLKQLRDTGHGSAQVDLEDVPEAMRVIDYDEYDYQKCFQFYHEPDLQKIQCDVHDRWKYVLDEIIWAFEQIADDNSDDQFHQNGFDVEGYREHHKRIDNGLRLFGRYFRGLWD